MIVLHAGWVARSFYLWGEAPVDTAGQPVSRRGEATAAALPGLPFDAGATALAAVVAPFVGQTGDPTGQSRPLTAWLPTLATADAVQPVASSALVAAPPDADAAVAPAPWAVSAQCLDREATVKFLAACLERETLGPGQVIGSDLAFWAEAFRFACALTVQQKFLPQLRVVEGAWRAGWEAVFTGADAGRFAALVRAMPPVSRALALDRNRPGGVAAAMVEEFIQAMVDYLARATDPDRAAAMVQPGVPGSGTLHDQWLQALRSPTGHLEGDVEEMAKLARHIAEWRQPLELASTAPVRLCFRLEEPPESSAPRPGDAALAEVAGLSLPAGSWRVRFLLQSVADPSLLLELPEVWKPEAALHRWLPSAHFQLKEYVLSALGQAAGLSSRLEASLRTTVPSGYELDTAGAHEFLTQTAWALQDAGFGVLLPAWWTGRGTKLHLSVRAQVRSPMMAGGSGQRLEALARFDWQVALGATDLTLADLQALAALKTPLVKIRGQWVQINGEELQAALALWQRRAARRMRVKDLLPMALGGQGQAPVVGLEFEGVRADGWIGELLAQLAGGAAFEELPQPAGFEGQLRPYQVRGFSWLAFMRRWGLGACLADDMGLGKTVQVLALVQRDWLAGGRGPALLVCPTSVTGNWEREAARFTPTLPVLVHHGTERSQGEAFAAEARRHALVITSYPLLHRDLERLKRVAWSDLILDEAQNIKNPETLQAKAARALPARGRLALTGTPVENHVGDLWSLMDFLNPGFLGGQAAFRQTFFLPIQVGRDAVATERLRRLTGPFILRRLKTDPAIIADLPEKLEMKVFCPLTREQASLYAAVVEAAMHELDESEGMRRRGVVLATVQQLKQVCNHPAQFLADHSALPGRSGKLARLTEMIEELLSAGDRGLIFTQFAQMGALLQQHLQATFGREVLFLHGALVKPQRDRVIDQFQNAAPGPPLLVLSLKAGGTGLNLTRANHVFHFDRWWNPAVENQATDRAFRIGQRRRVQVHKFICQGTLEEKIDGLIERKQTLAATLVGTDEAWLTELTTRELKEVFALRPGAVQE